jgi:hypothetical protein
MMPSKAGILLLSNIFLGFNRKIIGSAYDNLVRFTIYKINVVLHSWQFPPFPEKGRKTEDGGSTAKKITMGLHH